MHGMGGRGCDVDLRAAGLYLIDFGPRCRFVHANPVSIAFFSGEASGGEAKQLVSR